MEAFIVFACLACLVTGFVAGAMVYRNNAKKFEREFAEMKAKYDALKSKI